MEPTVGCILSGQRQRNQGDECDIWGSYGGEDKNIVLLGFEAV
jgi:hypothetical protein